MENSESRTVRSYVVFSLLSLSFSFIHSLILCFLSSLSFFCILLNYTMLLLLPVIMEREKEKNAMIQRKHLTFFCYFQISIWRRKFFFFFFY